MVHDASINIAQDKLNNSSKRPTNYFVRFKLSNIFMNEKTQSDLNQTKMIFKPIFCIQYFLN